MHKLTESTAPASALKAILALLILPWMVAASAEKLDLERLPDRLGSKGLVVMQLGASEWHGAEVSLANGSKSHAVNGFYAKALAPGKYTLASVRRFADYQLGTLTETTSYSTLKIDREFEIQAGKITHLGLVYLLADPSPVDRGESRDYVVLAFDNRGAEQNYLHDYYPALAANVSPEDVVLAPHSYANDKLKDVRELVYKLYADKALNAFHRGNQFLGMDITLPLAFTGTGHVIGDLGLVYLPVADNRVDFVAHDSVERVRQVEGETGEPLFYTATGGLLRVDSGRLIPFGKPPAEFVATGAAGLGADAIALVDRRLNFAVTVDGGQTWRHGDALAADAQRSLDVSFSAGAEHVYVIGRDRGALFSKPVAAVIDRASGQVREFDVPKKIRKGMRAVYETEAGLFVHSERPGSTPTTLYFRTNDSDKWSRREVRTYFGCRIEFPDSSGRGISAHCGPNQDIRLVSNDFGESWQAASGQITRRK